MKSGRILFVASQTGSQSDGGLESATRIFEHLADRYEWNFVTTHDTSFTDRWRSRGARVQVVEFDERAGKGKKVGRFAVWGARVLGHALARRPGVIHANDPRAFQAASLAATVVRRPILMTVRDTKPDGAPVGAQWHEAARRCRTIVTLSDGMGEFMRLQTGVPSDRLRTIHSIVDLERFRPPTTTERAAERGRLGIADGQFSVGCVGVIREKKNQLELLSRMLPPLLRQAPRAHLHFFGDYEPGTDTYARRFSATLDELGLHHAVTMHGHRSGMARIYMALDAVVIGSRNEGLARCMIEAMATGIPVVSFDVCSAGEMLEATGAGVVVRQGDHIGLADALAGLAVRPDIRRDMGVCGRAVAESRFDADQIVAAYRALYDEALKA